MINQQIITQRNLVSQPNITSHQDITSIGIQPIQPVIPKLLYQVFLISSYPQFFHSFLHRVQKQTINQICSEEKLIKYTPDFQPMLENISLCKYFQEKGRQISFIKQIFKLELLAYVLMIIISLIASLAYLAIYYLQIPFITSVRRNISSESWTYAISIFALLIVKFLLFSYAQILSHNLAVNAKIHLENTFIKSILESTIQNQTRSKYKRLYFQNINHVKELILFIPYFIVATVQIIGSMIFVFVNVGLFGVVPLGILMVLALINWVIFSFMKRQYHSSLQITEQETIRSNFIMNMLKE